MRRQNGFTLVELAYVLAIMVTMAGMASIAGSRWLSGARVSRATDGLVDYLVLARERAVSGYQQWRITLIDAGAGIAQSYVVDYCELTHGEPLGSPCLGTWVRYIDPRKPSANPAELGLIAVERGTGIRSVVRDTQEPVMVLTFDRSGYFLSSTVDAQVCSVISGAGGPVCRDEPSPVIRIQTVTGRIEICPSGQCIGT